ncbi:MAG: hypothetical protein RML45_14755 [Acetobacteraceae bacterium]|nr:hypothetical protein [Acetobacteraceae bacterium]
MVEGGPLSPAEAPVFARVPTTAADRGTTERRPATIRHIVTRAAAFDGFAVGGFVATADRVGSVPDEEDGLERARALRVEARPKRLLGTGDAFAVAGAGADGSAAQQGLGVIELYRHRLTVERLAAAIEPGPRARRARSG